MIEEHLMNELVFSYREIKHSLKFLSFFSHYTQPLYGFTNIEFIKDILPISLFTQSLVYKADFEIELAQKIDAQSNSVQPWLDRKVMLIEMLKHLNIYTPMAEQEADRLAEYWQLENQMMKGSKIDPPMLKRAIELRASDILMLHHICQSLTQVTLSEEAWSCLRSIEFIRDIEADLRHYYDDVQSGDFNIYRMFAKFYGTDARRLLGQELKLRKTVYQESIERLPFNCRAIFKELTARYYEERPEIEVPEMIEHNFALESV